MKKFILFAMFLMFAGTVTAQQTNTYLKDGKIMVETDSQTHMIDYSNDEKYVPVYNLKDWDVVEAPDKVQEALKVYKDKSQPLYTHRYWIVDKNDGNRKMIVEYTSRDQKERIYFTPDEDYAFYLNLLPAGTSVVTGMNLTTGKLFTVAHSGFLTLCTCPPDQTYVIVKDSHSDDIGRYVIYTKTGLFIKKILYGGTPSTICTKICQ